MQGKGAGPVNRVELESQVLCAALRQSCHIKDKIGAFTSVRELSHLFPDLLPPSEKDDEASSVNKDNFYLLLRVKPQTAANGVLSAYLRAIRRFLRNKKVVEHRTDFNRILNAGFILRKPRLRLSHDLVVARRWLHEESRMAQVQQQEITTDSIPAYRPGAAAGDDVPPDTTPPLAKPGAAASPTPPPLPAAAGPTPPPLPAAAAGPTPPPLPAAAGSTPRPLPAAAGPTPPPLPAAAGPTPPPLPPPAEKPSAPLPAAAASAAGFADVPALPVPEIAPPPLSDAGHGAPAPPPLPDVSGDEDDGFTTAPTAIPVPLPPAASMAPAQPSSSPHSAHLSSSLALAEHGEAGTSGEVAGAGIAGGAAPHSVSGSSPKSLRAESFRPVGRDTLPLPPQERVAGQMPLTDLDADVQTPAPAAEALEPTEADVDSDDFEYVPPAAASPVAPAAASSVQPPVAPAQPLAAPDPPGPTPAQPAQPAPPIPSAIPSASTKSGDLMDWPPPAAGSKSGDLMDFPPAAVRAQSAAAAQPPRDRPSGRIGKEATFVFDESQLRKPLSAGSDPLPLVVQLLEAAQVIGALEVQALKAQMAFAPNIPVEKHILNAGYVSAAELASAKLGESLLQRGKITMAQFQVAFYDERYSGLRMAESLQVRGWLSVEVRNAIDEWQKKSQ